MNKTFLDIINSDSDIKDTFLKVKERLLNEKFGQQEIMHIEEVTLFADKLAKLKKINNGNYKALILASLIHDIGRCYPEFSHHTLITDNYIDKYLNKKISNNYKIKNKIYRCVKTHSTGSKLKAESIIEKILFDADNLTIFTFFGFKRWFFKAESWGKANTLQEADESLKKIFNLALKNQFFEFRKSKELMLISFYSKLKPN